MSKVQSFLAEVKILLRNKGMNWCFKAGIIVWVSFYHSVIFAFVLTFLFSFQLVLETFRDFHDTKYGPFYLAKVSLKIRLLNIIQFFQKLFS